MAGEWITTIDGFATASGKDNRKRTILNSTTLHSNKDSSAMWVDKYEPHKFDDLAVHKKKVAEVEAWISHTRTRQKKYAPILLMTGPSGCGKTATLMVSAAAHSISVQEWTNPLSIDFSVSREAGLKHATLSSQFEEFLFRSGRYPSLLFSNRNMQDNATMSGNMKLLLLEDLPHHIIREPSAFRDVLRQYRLHQKNPLVIILSDGSVPDSVKRNLLPPDVQNQLQIQTISFNPVTTTLMSKFLTRIATQEKQQVSKDVLNAVISSASGDIRAAINSLQFHLQKGTAIPLTAVDKSKKKSNSKRRKSVDISDSLSMLGGKDTSLVLFRALGKILYCKRREPDQRVPPLPYQLENCYRDPLILEPEDILDHCCLSGSSYSLFLHHNFVPFFSNLDDLASTLEYFSTADIVNSRNSAVDLSSDSSSALDIYEGSIAARSVAFCNSGRATLKKCEESTGKWRPLHKPSWYQVSKKRRENECSSHRLFWNLNLPSQEMLLTLLPYLHKTMSFGNNCTGKVNLAVDQKEFLTTVINLPAWKTFSGSNMERIVESELGEEAPDNHEQKGSIVDASVDGETIKTSHKDPEEDFNIEEFSD